MSRPASIADLLLPSTAEALPHVFTAASADDEPEHDWQWGYCGQHLGWFYLGSPFFAGLIANRIVRAQHIRN